MLLKPFVKEKPKCKTFTLMLIPGRYGSLKTMYIPRFIISSIIIFNIIALILISIFILNYKNLKNNYDKYLEHNKELKVINENQQNEISELKKSADEIKSKLNELTDLEKKLKDRLNLNSKGTTAPSSAYLSGSGNQIESIDIQIQAMYKLLEVADKKIAYINSKPTILPSYGRITCNFGGRSNPFSGRGYEFHNGIDIANSYGTIIKASGDGIVEYSGWRSGSGKTVFINHRNGYLSVYGHCSKLLVNEGDTVKKGQTIALMGSTGRSTGTHVHFEIRVNGMPVDPLKIINRGL